VLPDRRYTFDRARSATTLTHLVADHENGMRVPDDAHIEEFLIYTEGWDSERDAAKREATFESHKQRSFHVHCWTQEEFLSVLRYSIANMKLSWDLLDVLFVDQVEDGFEYGFVLRRSLQPGDPVALSGRLDDVWTVLIDHHEASKQVVEPPPPTWRDVLSSVPAYRATRRRLRPLKRWGRACRGHSFGVAPDDDLCA
jgi:hypothetical protein